MISACSNHSPKYGRISRSAVCPGSMPILQRLRTYATAARVLHDSGIMLLLITVISTSLLLHSPRSLAAANKLPRDAMEHFFNQSFNNLQEELEIAAEENKSGIFIMFSDKDCPWCLKMKTTIMNRPDIQDYYREHFRLLTVDIRGDTMMTDFDGNEMAEKDYAFQQHRVRATPVFIFFDSQGKKTMRLTGIVRDAKEFLWLGEFVVSGAYEQTNFTKYKRERAEQEKSAALLQQ
jgi:thioredoxin-related protein